MNIIFFGTPDFVIPVLEALQTKHTLVGVVTAPDTIQGRKKILTPSPVKVFAEKNMIPVYQPTKLILDEFRSEVKQADLFVVAAYGKIIPQSILEIPRLGAINIHPSLLPKYRGPSPIQTALLQGDTETGITFIQMDAKMDHGPILYQETYRLVGDETFESLHGKMFMKAAAVLSKVIDDYVAGDIKPIEQDHEDVTFCHMITRESGFFDIDNPPEPETLDRMIRAYHPWPSAWFLWQRAEGKEQRVKLLPDHRVQLEGGKAIQIEEMANGYPDLYAVLDKLLVLSS